MKKIIFIILTLFITQAYSEYLYTHNKDIKDFINNNNDSNNITKEGLLLNLESNNTLSYSGTGSSWQDISGNNNNFSLNNGTYYSTTEKAFYLDGVDDFINGSITQFNTGNSSYTLNVWFKINQFDSYRRWLLVLGQHTSFSNHWLFKSSLSQFGSWDGSDINLNPPLSQNNWINITYTYNGSTAKIYKNGSKIIEATQQFNFSNNNLYIGKNVFGSADRNFGGFISIVQLYNKELTASEILNNYNNYKNEF